MTREPLQYAALIPDAPSRNALASLIDFAAQTKGFKPIPAADAHLTIGFNKDGFSDDAIATIKQVRDVDLQSAVAQGLTRPHGNLHLMYCANTKQIAVALEFPSHQVNELKAKLRHTFDGRLSLSHMTIGVLDPAALNLTLDQLQAFNASKDFKGLQDCLDTAFGAFLQSDAGKPLQQIAQMPLTLRMEKVHASPHTECPLDITDHPNPISTRVNALDHVPHSLLSSSVQAVSGWVQYLLGGGQAAPAAASAAR